MICPKCRKSKMSRVYSSKEDGDGVKRYRECTVCGYRYVTIEKFIGVPDPSMVHNQYARGVKA